MPHDKKGRLIEVGDFVKVKPYNTDQVVVGRVVHVNPATESCNASVAWTEKSDGVRYIGVNVNGVQLGSLGQVRQDYTECRAMELVLKADGSEPAEADEPAEDPPSKKDEPAPATAPEAEKGHGFDADGIKHRIEDRAEVAGA